MLGTLLADQRWFEALSDAQPRVAELLSGTAEQQKQRGYFHTLREICQQPATWLKTAEQMISQPCVADFRSSLLGIESLILTGSGSSQFAGNCVDAVLRRELGVVTETISGGSLLTSGKEALPPGRPALVVSLARSGDSPESVGAVSRLLATDPDVRHLVLTCNREGRLAEGFWQHPSVPVIALDDATNDRSLVMTSSFTNLLLAARFLGLVENPDRYGTICARLSQIASQLLRLHLATTAGVASTGFRRAIFLGSGSRLGAARESALKMLEMTAGSVATLCDSYLGFRHGPMSFAHNDTLIVCFLSSDPVLRAYESDLLQELDEKGLGLLKLIVGEDVPRDLVGNNDLVINCTGLKQLGDEDSSVIHVVVGQLLAFFLCLKQGLRPDSPSKAGIINRVVRGFKLHSSAGDHEAEP
jgi:D-galactosamine 6-phosphate deaminase/isomerase